LLTETWQVDYLSLLPAVCDDFLLALVAWLSNAAGAAFWVLNYY
jgi:hypothetical protein